MQFSSISKLKPAITTVPLSYVYWTVHHLDNWIKIDQLDVTCFITSLFNSQHVSNVSTPILRSLRLICWVISWVVLLWYDVCWCYFVVWLGWCGIRMQAEASLFNYQDDARSNKHKTLSVYYAVLQGRLRVRVKTTALVGAERNWNALIYSFH